MASQTHIITRTILVATAPWEPGDMLMARHYARQKAMKRLVSALLFTMSITACGGSSAQVQPSPSHVAVPSPIPLPAAATNPNYPPMNLADVVALGDKGTVRRFIGAESQNLGQCYRGWERINEPAGLPSEQRAADVVAFAMSRQLLSHSCGGFVFGTTNDTYCNCYHGENGYLEIDRGPYSEPAPGQMEIIFQSVEDHPSAGDWDITVQAPTV